ncbi:MAG: aldo/keto reductase [Candidatus Nanopelagicales bacterium]
MPFAATESRATVSQWTKESRERGRHCHRHAKAGSLESAPTPSEGWPPHPGLSWGGFAEGRNNLFTDPALTEIGAAQGKSVAQVVLRWLTQRNVVAIPKSVHPERMAANLDVFDFTLSDEQMARIGAMYAGTSLFFDHRDPAMVSLIGNRPIHD